MAPSSSVPELQQKLFRRMGIDVPGQTNTQSSGSRRQPSGKFATRKEQRKAHRVQKKSHQYGGNGRRNARHESSRPRNGPIRNGIKKPDMAPSKSVPKSGPMRIVNPALEDDSLSEGDFLDDDEEEDDEGDFEGFSDDDQPKSKAAGKDQIKNKALAQDDAAIEEFERKLGIKKGRKDLPQSFKDDGLDDLMADLNDEEDGDQGESDAEARKRKTEFDDWLLSKRRRTDGPAKQNQTNGAKGKSVKAEDDFSDASDDFDEDDEDDDLTDEDMEDVGFEGSSGDEDGDDLDDEEPAPRQRENPYVAPTTGQVVAKYVPPSLRKASGSEGEARTRLRKQVQGQINRLTDTNILSIVGAIETLYQNNARGDMTEALTDTILAQVWKPESLPDQFFVLTGGFCAAVYKLIGASFGSHILRRLLTDFNVEYDKVKGMQADESAIPKESSNLLALISQLYVFEVVSCKIIFDLMERLLDGLNEVNVELLLRICRMAGRLLRRDDPQALKHVSSVLGKAVAKVGYNNVSVRTKFMIETIDDLKKSKPKAKGMDSAVVSEHVMRMKKKLGELKSQSRRLDGLAPMGIGLEDVENADVRGKWWLVGASVPVKEAGGKVKGTEQEEDDIDAFMISDNEDMDFVLPDYPKKARAQGLATPTQIAIFTALVSASDADSGYRQFIDLRLKRDENNEIARVLVQCVGSEAAYNSYYAEVARQACTSNKIRFAFQNRLWQILRGLGEQLFGEDEDYEETADSERMKDEKRLDNTARFYAALLLGDCLNMTILKPLELPKIGTWTSLLIERLLIAVLKGCRSKDEQKEALKLGKIFGGAKKLPTLAAGLHWFLRKKIRRTTLISSKELQKLEGVIINAQAILL